MGELEDLGFELAPEEPTTPEPAKTLTKEETLALIAKQLRDPDIPAALFAKLTRQAAELNGWRPRREIIYKGKTGRRNRRKDAEDAASTFPISAEMAAAIKREKEQTVEEYQQERARVLRLMEVDKVWAAAHPGNRAPGGQLDYSPAAQQERVDWFEANKGGQK